MYLYSFKKKYVWAPSSEHSRAVAQAVSRRLLTAEAGVRIQGSPRGICVGQSGIVTGFTPSPSVSPVIIIPPLLHIHSCIVWGLDNEPVSGRSSTETVSPHRNTDQSSFCSPSATWEMYGNP
jgi:hypothetical protein